MLKVPRKDQFNRPLENYKERAVELKSVLKITGQDNDDIMSLITYKMNFDQDSIGKFKLQGMDDFLEILSRAVSLGHSIESVNRNFITVMIALNLIRFQRENAKTVETLSPYKAMFDIAILETHHTNVMAVLKDKIKALDSTPIYNALFLNDLNIKRLKHQKEYYLYSLYGDILSGETDTRLSQNSINFVREREGLMQIEMQYKLKDLAKNYEAKIKGITDGFVGERNQLLSRAQQPILGVPVEDHNELRAKAYNLENEIAKLKDEALVNADLKQSLTTANSKIMGLQNELTNLNTENTTVNERLKSLQDSFSLRKKIYQEFAVKYEAMGLEVKTLKQSIGELSLDNEKLREMNKALTEEIEKLKTDLIKASAAPKKDDKKDDEEKKKEEKRERKEKKLAKKMEKEEKIRQEKERKLQNKKVEKEKKLQNKKMEKEKREKEERERQEKVEEEERTKKEERNRQEKERKLQNKKMEKEERRKEERKRQEKDEEEERAKRAREIATNTEEEERGRKQSVIDFSAKINSFAKTVSDSIAKVAKESRVLLETVKEEDRNMEKKGEKHRGRDEKYGKKLLSL